MNREPLTERELAVISLLVSGASNEAIAARLGVSINTVKTHVRGVLRKLKVETRTAAVSRAIELGIVFPHQWRG
ncbi:MAG: response regulator transcription factor [Aquimonas sp.]|nr:response regulator transcription factor [Aquimonas sp.]